jgi:hypothetical protein
MRTPLRYGTTLGKCASLRINRKLLNS